ncbi:VF530 family DNA-binding protein [Oceanisphaera sp.]|uniref:VF530 family protein n=1 Tax=Oceanisphaera sp. TaxID=1929979 RepID=UPI003A92AE11
MTEQPNNPLHGITLKALLTELVERYGWEELANRVNINCFKNDPSIKSSLTFLRRTPWAREQVEALYLELIAGPWGKSRR